MTKKNFKKTNKKFGKENKNTKVNNHESEQIAIEIAKLTAAEGDELSEKIIGLLAEYGSDPLGLTIETYAMTRALAMLLMMAVKKKFKAVELMDMLTPSITREVEEIWRRSVMLGTDE